jgi:hypothetical protein
MEAIRSSKTSVLTRATWHNISKDGILHAEEFHNSPYILESNPHSVFGNFLNRKKLVRHSVPSTAPYPQGVWLNNI